MKKMLLLILLIIPTVKAATYDLEYKPIENLKLKTEETKKYRWYKEEKYVAYFKEGENPEIFKKTNEYYFSPYSEWSKEKPIEKNGREIIERKKYIYQDINKIRYFQIEVDSTEEVISEFAVLANGHVASSTSYCNGCSNAYYMIHADNGYDANFSIGKLSLVLEDAYDPSEISFRIKFEQENIRYKIIIYGDKENKNIYYQKEILSDTNLHAYTLNEFEAETDAIEEIEKYSESNKYALKEKYTEYSYRDKYYKYEANLRNYYPTYEEKVEGYIKDDKDYIVTSKYYYLDQVEVKDNIEIRNSNYDLLDYISSTEIPETASNIDISKNGTYQVKYIFPSRTITTKVKVNTDNEYVKDLENKVENKNKEILEVTNLKNEIIERLESNLHSKDEIISKKNTQTIVKKSNPIPIILITIGVMMIIFCIYKSFSKKI